MKSQWIPMKSNRYLHESIVNPQLPKRSPIPSLFHSQVISTLGTSPREVSPIMIDFLGLRYQGDASSGWWFGTFFIFHNIWDNPSHWLIFFKMVETTNQYIVWCTNLGLSENGVYPVTAILIRMMMNEWMQQRPGTVCSDEPRILQSSKYDWMIWLVPTS